MATSSRKILVLGAGASLLVLALLGLRLGLAPRARGLARGSAPEARAMPPAEEPGGTPPALLEARAPLASASTDGGALRAPITFGLSGSVTGPEGTPVAGARVSCVDLRGRWHATTAVDGAYEITDLDPGLLWVRVHAAGFAELTRTATLTRAAPHARLDLVLSPATRIRVYLVTPSGQPWTRAAPALARRVLPVADVSPLPDPFRRRVGGPSNLGPSAFVRAAAGERSGVLGELFVSAPLPLHVALTRNEGVLAQELVEGDAVSFTLPLEDPRFEAALTVRFTGAAGTPLAGLLPVLWSPSVSSAPPLEPVPGEYRFAHLDPGRYVLRARSGTTLFQAPVSLATGAHLDLGTIPLDETFEVAVRLVDESGAPVGAGAGIGSGGIPSTAVVLGSCGAPGDCALEPNLYEAVPDDAQGFSLFLVPGAYTLQVLGARLSVPGRVQGLAGERHELALVAPYPGTLVVLPADPGWGRETYELVTEDGIVFGRGAFLGPHPKALRVPRASGRVHVLDGTGRVLRRIPFDAREGTCTLVLGPR